jgi:hypothetical protein
VLDRTLVFASYQSAALVPRDIVISRYANLGAARESWTVPCYILDADFADVMPPDEDPMPFDGNPHALPGMLIPNNNLFVLPQYPELGWNINPDHHVPEIHQVHIHEEVGQNIDIQMEEQLQQEEDAEVIQDSGSILVNHSESSTANSVHQVQLIINHAQFYYNISHWEIEALLSGSKAQKPCFGPCLPPVMQYKTLLGMSLSERCPLKIPAKLTDNMSFKFISLLPEDFPSQCTTASEEYDEMFCNTTISQNSLEFDNDNVFVAPTARRLQFDNDSKIVSTVSSESVCLSLPATTKTVRTKGKKRETPTVETKVRRSTRSQVRNNGYKLEPMRDQPTPKKKPRCKSFLMMQ